MCTAENIYHTTCGCWSGFHVIWECPKASLGPCPDIVSSGVLRKPGKCLTCRRRCEWHQKVLPPSASPTLASDHAVDDRLKLLSEMMRRALETPARVSASRAEEPGNRVDGNRDARPSKAQSEIGDDGVFKTLSTAWHQQ
ncbi:uncharacterized protein CTRU02_200111 [Colletotrichum truncatum]|uniref:Uncharacterized protein n=1 Tax=Colletotrichum truncatum TaxID=5467 RepID=A0ACC3ZDW9_COLTU|nr:uncharacterized protein CTRU02_04987 [Colletotrichum truncatum]KAF6794786.1 hypothetical protein CTRU02_04987 [Colletotrichum truncatum]